MSMIKKTNKLLPRYSGRLSLEFWNRVNNLKEPGQQSLYYCGVLLQNLEGSVLQWLENAEMHDKKLKYRKER